MTAQILTQARLKELMHYCPDTGILIWRHRDRSQFSARILFEVWKSRFCGKPAGSITPNKYREIKYKGRSYSAHKLTWLYVYGEYPTFQIKHINHDRADNRIENLRKRRK